MGADRPRETWVGGSNWTASVFSVRQEAEKEEKEEVLEVCGKRRNET